MSPPSSTPFLCHERTLDAFQSFGPGEEDDRYHEWFSLKAIDDEIRRDFPARGNPLGDVPNRPTTPPPHLCKENVPPS